MVISAHAPHIEYSTYQFLEESKGDGIHPPLLPPTRYGTEKLVVKKKACPEKVKEGVSSSLYDI